MENLLIKLLKIIDGMIESGNDKEDAVKKQY